MQDGLNKVYSASLALSTQPLAILQRDRRYENNDFSKRISHLALGLSQRVALTKNHPLPPKNLQRVKKGERQQLKRQMGYAARPPALFSCLDSAYWACICRTI